jgi:Uma2 family endonuclease
MLDEESILLLPTEEDLPDCDEKPVDNELQLLAPMLLRGILSYIWDERLDWFFGINLGIYPAPGVAPIGPDAFLSLGAARVRENNQLRLSYLVYRENVMPQWVLEVVSKQPGGEYDVKFQQYAQLGVLYYTIYNPSHHSRDQHDPFEVYRLEAGCYVRQIGNPVWMPELGLGIGHEQGFQEKHHRDWLYWYDQQGRRYPVPEHVLKQEKLLREREQLMRIQTEQRLEQEVKARLELARQLETQQGAFLEIAEQLEIQRLQRESAQQQQRNIEDQLESERRSRLEAEQALAQTQRMIGLNLLQQGLTAEAIASATGLTLAQIAELISGRAL